MHGISVEGVALIWYFDYFRATGENKATNSYNKLSSLLLASSSQISFPKNLLFQIYHEFINEQVTKRKIIRIGARITRM